jgi:hypothetical protein
VFGVVGLSNRTTVVSNQLGRDLHTELIVGATWHGVNVKPFVRLWVEYSQLRSVREINGQLHSQSVTCRTRVLTTNCVPSVRLLRAFLPEWGHCLS